MNEKRKIPIFRGFLLPGVVTMLLMLLVSAALLFLLSVLTFHYELDVGVVRAGMIVVYFVAGFAGGFLIGKWKKEKKYLWGLSAGILYFGILLLISLIRSGGNVADMVHMITVLVLSTLSAMIGGMVS